ncbi:hypothetical protein LS215_0822 [Sulfolobus islandicus L.S.2.15]|uniref:Uncharacterized protein n=1 Tax=Saccharolobus islandicus (strain L.S.2.15 / Lassen \|nr:hypothetical protein [Sulfolobus islandicus]ACP34882.1 hypothetical protein LS215_0822 [Sulfolobus islandicus L.S.2.15]
MNDYERLLILLLLLYTITSTTVFTSFISDQKSALLFSIALFINIFMAGYYLVKYATSITSYVLFTLPICLPTALYNWDEIYAQARIAYNEISGVRLPYVNYNTILYTLLLYSVVSAISMWSRN